MVKIDINNGTRIIEAKGDEPLIESLRNEGIYLPSACGSKGKCGLCKVRIVNPELPFNELEKDKITVEDRNKDFHLSCQVLCRNDLKIELPQEFLGSIEYSAVVRSKRILTSDIMELTLDLISPASISFHPGQYILFKVPAHDDKKAVMRPFSIASSNFDTGFIQLNTRLNPEGVCTPWIFKNLREGDNVKFLGPKGNFYIRNTERPMLFIGGGSGMAPIRSILRTMMHHKIKRKAIFFFGALKRQDLFYLDEMKQLENELSDFRFIPALSNEPSQSDWAGERGLIPDVANRLLIEDASEYEAYLCGKPAMIQSCMSILELKKIPSDRAYFDLFNIAKTPK